MAAVLLRMAVVWQARWVKVWLALLTLGLGVAMQVEVVRVPGYELAEVLSLVTALALWPLGVRAGRFEAQTREKPALAVAGALGVMMLWGFAVSALALIVCLATTPCDPFVAASWLLWLVVPSMVVTAAASVWVGARSPRWRGALLWWVVLLLASAALTAWPLVFGPQVYAFNHFGGYLPGPLYDEALSFTAGVGWFRLTTLALAVAFAGALQVRSTSCG